LEDTFLHFEDDLLWAKGVIVQEEQGEEEEEEEEHIAVHQANCHV